MLASKKKSDLTTILDDLRSEDIKKRLSAVQDIKEVAAAMGPAKVKTQLLIFLAQFIDDQENIVLELLTQLQGFTSLVGGIQNEKCLLPLLISFCKTDEKKSALKACQLIQRILTNCKEQAVDTIKKLIKTDLNVAKQCGIKLIADILPQLESCEGILMEMYIPMHTCDNPQLKIIASRYLSSIIQNLKSKDEVPKILEAIYGEGDELAKIHALPALVQYYNSNNNFALSKFKNLSVINSWRINIKICEIAEIAAHKISKPHFKLIFEPMLFKFMTSVEPQLRSASCRSISALCKHLSDDEQRSKLLPVLKKLVSDSVQYVKIELSKNIVGICGYVSIQFMNQWILPMIFTFIKDPNSEITLSIIKSFEFLASKIPKEVFDEKIIKPLLSQLNTDNWRVKCEILDILKGFLITQNYLNQSALKVFIGLTDDKIDAVRLKVNQFIIQIIRVNPKEWSQAILLPRVFAAKENVSYIKKQNLLQIIDKTASIVSDKAMKELYQGTIVNYLGDKVPNVKLKTMQVVKSNIKLLNPTIQKQVQKLKDDKDTQIKDFAKKLRA